MTTEAAADNPQGPSLGEFLRAAHEWLVNDAAVWVSDHREEIGTFLLWSQVQEVCERTGLYAPAAPAWHVIADAEHAAKTTGELTELILAAYAPAGSGHEALRDELHGTPLLATHRREVDEVLASLHDGRHYVTVCGALPLVEGILAAAYGKWQKRTDLYPLQDRLDESGALAPEDEAELMANNSAIEMLTRALPKVWQHGTALRPGTLIAELNRHVVLHDTGHGWDTPDNAVRAVLLVAAAARVARPLLAPKST